jgi:hypothetical protein
MAYNFVKSQVMPTQTAPIDASNPASGINNIPMQGGIDATGAIGNTPVASSGVQPEDAIEILSPIVGAGKNATQYKQSVENLFNKLSNESIKDKVGKLLQALEKNNDVRTQTKDPQTGLKDPTASQMANQIITEIKEMQKQSKEASVTKFNLRVSEETKNKKKKRDSRGNPFKVLMGKIGKLIDHGISKRDTIRFIMKDGHWNEETVEKAYNLVRDYNKKKHRKDKKLQEVQEKEASAQKEDIRMGSSFNLHKYAQTSLELDGLYGIQPDWSKRSTAELIMRAVYLTSLQEFDKDTQHNEGRKAASKKGVANQLKDIKQALEDRGFDKDELFEHLQRRVK